MIPSPYCTIGPFYLKPLIDGLDDLTVVEGRQAQGQKILLSGRIVEEGNRPVFNAVLEIWQPDAKGIFRHPLDPRAAQADPGFSGWGRTRTDKEGLYQFRTILPGISREDNGLVRRPHINLMVLAIGLTRRLATTVFFSDSPEAVNDPVLDCVSDPLARRRLFAVSDREANPAGVPGYRFDIVLRGDNETPFFLD